MALEKPQLKRLGMRAYTFSLWGSLSVGCLFAIWFKKNVVEKRQKHYKDFYDNWDDDKEFEAMRKAGIFKGFEIS